jgi:rootletin
MFDNHVGFIIPKCKMFIIRGHDDGRDGAVDVDPEVVRKGVRNLMQQVAQIERERDDYKTQVATVKKQLHEAHESQSKGDSKLNKVLQSLRGLQDEKGSLEAKLSQKSVELQSQSAALKKKNGRESTDEG